MTASAAETWEARAAALELPTGAFVDGESRPAISGETFASVNPATEETLCEVASCDAADVDAAVAAARAAFESGVWSRADPAQRKQTLLRLVALLAEHADELALLETLDVGKPIGEALTIDVPGATAVFQWYAECVDKLYGEVAPTAGGNLALVEREPLGVVGAVVPWNFPLDMAAWKCAPALAAGNSVVLKPAEQSPLSALRLAELALEAGLPPGVLNVVPGYGDRAGRALGLHPDVDCVAFTGSGEVGRMFLGYAAASNGKQVWLELGGKSPNLVFADAADLDEAAAFACRGIFTNQGEICSANSRLLVEASVKDALLERVVAHVERLRLGDPLDPQTTLGALVDAAHAERVMGYVEQGKRDARLVTGGERARVGGRGCFVAPTVFDAVPLDSPIAREEIFGPVLAVIPFADEREAVALANDTSYGLAASVWTGSLDRAHRVARALRVGTVSVNTVDALSPQTPFGGVKQSGYGRDLSLHALDKYTSLKTTWIRYAERARP